MRDALVTIGRERHLAYTDVGDPAGRCLFFFHGAPMSRLHLVGLDGEFAARGLRVVSPDRPGYGRSSPQPNRALADWPADVMALADVLGVRRFAVAGHSSGGPYAVACAAMGGDRVTAGLVLGGVTDMGWPDAWNGYPESEATLMRMHDEADLVAWCAAHFGTDGRGFLTASPFEMPAPDEALFADEREAVGLTTTIDEAFRQGVRGYAQDVFVQRLPWPFDPGRITIPVEVVHGELDSLIPQAHSRHTAEIVRGARFRTLPGHGHLTVVSELPSLAAGLAREDR